MIRRRRALALPVAVLAVATLSLSACSDAGETPNTPVIASPEFTGSHATGEHNQADVEFATLMFANRLQMVQLIGLAKTKTKNAQVIEAAESLEDDQGGEIANLGGWLDGWGVQAANIKPADHAGVPGVLPQKAMDAVTVLDGAAFDKAWTTTVIDALKGSISVGQDEVKKGKNEQAKTYATQLVEEQGATISDLTKLMGDLA